MFTLYLDLIETSSFQFYVERENYDKQNNHKGDRQGGE